MTDLNEAIADREKLIADCKLAADLMDQANTFPTGVDILRDAAKALALARTEADAIAATLERAAVLCCETADEALESSGEVSCRAVSLWFRNQAKTIRALITQPQSDALAAVRAEARREERLTIIAGVDYEASVCPCEEDAVVMRDIARLIAADFSYDDADAALAEGTA